LSDDTYLFITQLRHPRLTSKAYTNTERNGYPQFIQILSAIKYRLLSHQLVLLDNFETRFDS